MTLSTSNHLGIFGPNCNGASFLPKGALRIGKKRA